MGIFSRRKTSEVHRDAVPAAEMQLPIEPLSIGGLRLISSDNDALATYYSCIELISNSIASVPIVVKDRKTLKPIPGHPLESVFSSPNVPKYLLIKKLISDAYRFGNGFAYIKRDSTGHPVGLVYCKPNSVRVQYNASTRELYYFDKTVSITKKIEPVNMIHVRKDTYDCIAGIPMSQIGSAVFDLAKSTDGAAKDYFDSGCAVSGVITSEKSVSPDQQKQMLRNWKLAMENQTNGSRVAVLPLGFKYNPVADKANDSQLLESRQYNAAEICKYFQVNMSQWSTIESAQLDLIIHALMPWLCILEEEFNNKLILPSERESIVVDLDEDKIAFASKQDTAAYYVNLVKNGIITINEAREALGYCEKDGLDDNFIPYTDIAQNTIGASNKNGDDDQPAEQ